MDMEMEDKGIIPGLPDEISVICLARLPIGLHPLASCVSRAWRYVLQLPLIDDIRKDLDLEEHHIFLWAPAKFGLLSRKYTQCYAIDTRLLRCHAVPPPPATRGYPHGFHCETLAMGREILITRIRSGDICQNDEVFCYNIVSNRWCQPPPVMSTQRTWFATARVNGFVYVAGGGTGLDFANLKSVERFDIKNKRWERVTDMNMERYMASGIEWKGSFCVIGGCRLSRDRTYAMHNSAELWDPETSSWKLIPGMWPNEMWKVTVVKGQLYGLKYSQTREVMWFNEQKNQWVWFGVLPQNLEGDVEYDLIGIGGELWMLVSKHARRKCNLFAASPDHLPLSWRLLPFSFEYYPTNICVATL